jgi:hypothetical protein
MASLIVSDLEVLSYLEPPSIVAMSSGFTTSTRMELLAVPNFKFILAGPPDTVYNSSRVLSFIVSSQPF